MMTVKLWTPVQPVASVAVTLKLYVPCDVGVPESAPPVDRLTPLGNAPALVVKLYEAVPPLAVSVALYAVPTNPFGKVAGVIVIAPQGGLITSV